jgi:hypothetical protein
MQKKYAENAKGKNPVQLQYLNILKFIFSKEENK